MPRSDFCLVSVQLEPFETSVVSYNMSDWKRRFSAVFEVKAMSA